MSKFSDDLVKNLRPVLSLLLDALSASYDDSNIVCNHFGQSFSYSHNGQKNCYVQAVRYGSAKLQLHIVCIDEYKKDKTGNIIGRNRVSSVTLRAVRKLVIEICDAKIFNYWAGENWITMRLAVDCPIMLQYALQNYRDTPNVFASRKEDPEYHDGLDSWSDQFRKNCLMLCAEKNFDIRNDILCG